MSNPAEVSDSLFDLLKDMNDEKVSINKFWSAIKSAGLRQTDPRLNETRERLLDIEEELKRQEFNEFRVDRTQFKECIQSNIHLIGKIFRNDLVLPEFRAFCNEIEDIYFICKENNNGKLGDYIPQLARVDPNRWGVSVCTIDGQRFDIGDTNVPFCLQSCAKPLNYALAVSDLGAEEVHRYVGQEPSGRCFNELTLDANNKPHNPMINTGAIVITSILRPSEHVADRFEYIVGHYKKLAGGEHIGFSNSTYLSERDTADRNFALGYYLRENKCFTTTTDLTRTLEFYFQLCSVELSTKSASVIAATFANGGTVPTTGEKVLMGDAVRNTLSLMHSCGMYDYSGQFAFKVGLPAKSGVSGVVLVVVPNVMGICVWSPLLDNFGNSCRGVQFCEELVQRFSFHNYDDLNYTEKKMDPRKRVADNSSSAIVNLISEAASGNITTIRRFARAGMDMASVDYDGRTPLHLASAEGHLDIVQFLLEHCKVPHSPLDRWCFTPLDEALKFEHTNVATYLEDFSKRLEVLI